VQPISQPYQGKGFYFTGENGDLYEYSSSLSKVSAEKVTSIYSSSPSALQASTDSSVNVMNASGQIVFRYEPGEVIMAATLNSAMDQVYYVTDSGELHHYNRARNASESLGISLYPMPRQMVLDEINELIYYHDKSLIYRININTKKVSVLTKVFFPIQSIAHNSSTNEVYFSTSTDGKIYKLNQAVSTIFLVHEPISARGSSIAIDSNNEKLYFSKSNGRDIQIESLDLNTKEVNDAIVLYNINYINQLVVKD
tara:strand:+ start:197 stop:958 length:762 start_codon:yes stop_codon:yes gene_type:complete